MNAAPETHELAIRENAVGAMKTLIVSMLLLLAAGWVMLIDTGMVFEGQANPDHFSNLLVKRALGMSVGILLMGFIWLTPPKFIRWLSFPAMLLAGFFLALVFTSLGIEERGSTRWVRIGPFVFQPIEYAKLALVWFLADQLARLGTLNRAMPNRLAFPAIVIAIAVILVGLQPNLSGALFLIILTLAMAWLGGMNGRLALGLAGSGAAAFAAMLAFNPDRLARFLPMFRPFADLDGAGYQVGLSLWAITNGNFLGMGPGHSVAMYSLPDHTTDFMYSVLCEEWGFLGGIIVLALFAVLVYAGFIISLAQRDRFRILLGCGITSIIGLQAAINIGVTLGVLPTTGVPLPFLSAGGSNLVFSFMEIGLLLNLGKTAGVAGDQPKAKEIPDGDIREYAPRVGRVRKNILERNYRPAPKPVTSGGRNRKYDRS